MYGFYFYIFIFVILWIIFTQRNSNDSLNYEKI